MDGLRFCPVESDGIYGLLDLPEREGQHGGRLICQREQSGAGFRCRLVSGPKAEKTRYENAKGVSVRLARDDADNRILPLPDFALYDSKRSSNLVLAHG